MGDPAYIGPVTIDRDTSPDWTPADTDQIVEVSAAEDLPGVAFGAFASFASNTVSFHERVFVAGTYDVSLMLDVDDDGVLSSGDRHVQIQDVAVTNGARFDFSAQLAATAPLP